MDIDIIVHEDDFQKSPQVNFVFYVIEIYQRINFCLFNIFTYYLDFD
jgi:hypothetical protein